MHFPDACHVSAFLSFLAAPFFFCVFEKGENELPLVRLLRHSSYLLRAIPHSVDSKKIPFFFLFVFLPPLRSSIMSLVISPTIVLHLVILSVALYSARFYTQLQL